MIDNKQLVALEDAPRYMPVYASSIFQSCGQRIGVPEGLNIAQIVERLCPCNFLDITAHVYIEGDYIPRNMWGSVTPHVGANVSISIVPMGGGGSKNPLRTVLQLALLAVVIFAVPALLGAEFTAFGLTAAQTLNGAQLLVGAVGALIINAIAPPPVPRFNGGNVGSRRDSPTLFIEGARNSISRYGVIPVVLGKHRLVPPLAGMTFTESSADKQFARQLFTWGYGDLVLTEKKIGQTLLSNFEEVETEDILDGSSGTSTLNLYPKDVFEDGLGISLTFAAGFQTRTSQIDADEIIIDVTFPNGLARFNDEGTKLSVIVDIQIELAITGSNNFNITLSKRFLERTTAAVRRSMRFQVPRNQYDVRIKRVTADRTSSQIFDKVSWTALRTVTNENPINFNGISLTAMRIRATDQLNGAVNQFNAIVSNKIPTWTGSTWALGETSNPADIFRYVLSNSQFLFSGGSGANERPLQNNRVDLNDIQDWHDYCSSQGFEYNAVIDFETSVRSVLQEVAAAGRASVTVRDGKWSIVVDKPKNLISQHFTPRNTWGYSTTKNFVDIPHAFRVLFLNEDIGYIQDERLVFDDGFNINNATKIETLELPGITNSDLVWKHAREHIATLRLQPREHIFSVDVEHLVAPRGSRCKLAHDVINVGLAQARIKDIQVSGSNAISVTLDEQLFMDNSKVYGLVIRTANNSSLTKGIVTDPAAMDTIEFVSPFDLVFSDMAIGDLVMFGELGKETIDIIIKDIIPESDMVARISARDYNEAIFTASTGVIPPFTSGATFPPELQEPVAPVLDVIQSDEEVQIRNTDGSISSRMVISIRNFNVGAVEPIVTFRATGSDSFAPAKVVSATSEVITIEDLDQSVRYDIRIRYKRVGAVSGILNNIFSPALEINNVEFLGTSAPPPDITNFFINITGNTGFLSWDAADVIDFSHYIIKFNTATLGASWNGSAVLKDNLTVNSFTTPLQVGTYLIKAVDRGGNESVNETVIVNSTQSEGFNAVVNLIEEPVFAGVKNNTVVNLGAIELLDNSLPGEYLFSGTIDLGDVFVSRVTPNIVAVGNNQTNLMSNWTTMASVTNLSGTSSVAWSAQLEIRTTEDDPVLTPTWTSFMPLVVGDVRFRAAEFRLLLSSSNADVTPSVSVLEVSIDMPDRSIRFEDQLIPVSGFTFSASPPFKQILDVQVTGQNMATGDYGLVTSKSPSGATVKFFDKNDVAKSIIADVQLNGFGKSQI